MITDFGPGDVLEIDQDILPDGANLTSERFVLTKPDNNYFVQTTDYWYFATTAYTFDPYLYSEAGSLVATNIDITGASRTWAYPNFNPSVTVRLPVATFVSVSAANTDFTGAFRSFLDGFYLPSHATQQHVDTAKTSITAEGGRLFVGPGTRLGAQIDTKIQPAPYLAFGVVNRGTGTTATSALLLAYIINGSAGLRTQTKTSTAWWNEITASEIQSIQTIAFFENGGAANLPYQIVLV